MFDEYLSNIPSTAAAQFLPVRQELRREAGKILCRKETLPGIANKPISQ